MKMFLLTSLFLLTNELYALNSKMPILQDTVIGSMEIEDDLAGSSYRKRGTSYFLIVKGDTSEFRPIFIESNDGNVRLILNLPYRKNKLNHEQRLMQLQRILSKSSSDYDLKNLNGISIGRLVLLGSLTINLTSEYFQEFGGNSKIRTEDYQDVSKFLLDSQLTSSFNEVLDPYQLTITKINIEKAFLTTKEELIMYSQIESNDLPEKVLDCMTWLTIENTHNSR